MSPSETHTLCYQPFDYKTSGFILQAAGEIAEAMRRLGPQVLSMLPNLAKAQDLLGEALIAFEAERPVKS